MNARDESDKGSGTEITQVIIRSRPEAFGNDLVPAITTRKCEGKNEELGRHLGLIVHCSLFFLFW